MRKLSIIFIALLLLLAACDSGGGEDPTVVVDKYLKARLASDVDQLRALSCADWESQVVLEADSFRGRDAELVDVSCEVGGKDGDYTIVNCEGHIAVVYQGENRDFPLKNYRLLQEDGEWKMCGEAN
jgi:hypothetical protein